ncbi:MAG: methyl-accepting chemotaxis protein [Bdellovibrionia bacterium]
MKKLGLRSKFILGFSLFLLGGMALTGAITYGLASQIVEKLAMESLTMQLRSVEASVHALYQDSLERQKLVLNQYLKKYSSKLAIDESNGAEREIENQITHEKLKAKVPHFLFDGKPVTDHDIVDRISAESGSEVTLFVETPQGFVRASTSIKKTDGTRAEGTFIPPTSPVYKTLQEGKEYLGRAFVVNDWFVTAYHPIIQGGRTVGAFFIGTRENNSYTLIQQNLKTTKILDTGYFYIMDNKGTMILHPTKEGQNVLSETDLDGKLIFKEIMDHPDGSMNYRWLNAETKKPQDKLAIYRYFPEVEWHVAASLNQDELRAEVYHLRRIIVMVTLFVTLVTSLIIGWFTGSVVRVLEQLARALKARVQAISQQAEKAQESSQRLTASATQQAAALQETAATMEEVNATIQKNLESTQTTEALSSKSRVAAENGAVVMDRLMGVIQQMGEESEKTSKDMTRNHEELAGISKVIATIEERTRAIHDIVFQTKLLSFNASVEAARAGEHGKGFAIVAEEVGRLAQLTGKTAQEIQQTVAQSMEEVASLVEKSRQTISQSIERSKAQTTNCVKSAEEARDALTTILAGVQEAHQSVTQIAVASREQAKAMGEIAKALSQIDEVTQENATLASGSSEISNELGNNAIQLSDVTQKLETLVRGNQEPQQNKTQTSAELVDGPAVAEEREVNKAA